MRKFFGALLVLVLICIFRRQSPAEPTAAPDSAKAVMASDTKGTPDERADQLLKQMTQEEKILLLYGGDQGFWTHPITRLGIGRYRMSDGPQGVRNPSEEYMPVGTAMPSGSALAATFDPELAAAYGRTLGQDDRARGVGFQLGPGVNIERLPVNGRNFEYFGEDPFLASIIAVNWVKACSAQGSIPTIKHFAANNEEIDRNSVDVHVDERTMNEIYLPAFKRAVTSGAIVAVMCSYNGINGSYTSNNDWLLNQTLKKAWGFPGLVMSDWGASHQTSDLARGLDLEMPSGQNLNQTSIPAALASGVVKQSDIDNAVHRILRSEIAQGWMDIGWKQQDSSIPMDNPASAQAALDVARGGIVLLKNDHDTLPLDRTKVKTIVVVGPNATSIAGGGNARALTVAVARPPMPINYGGGGSGDVWRPQLYPAPPLSRIEESDYLKQITHAAGPGAKIVFLPTAGYGGAEQYNVLANARTAPDGKPGLNLSIEIVGEGTVQMPLPQTSVNLSWQPGQLPLGVPYGRDANFIWSGVLVAPQDGDWEVAAQGTPIINIDGKTVASGTMIHLQKDKPAAITIKLAALANPPAILPVAGVDVAVGGPARGAAAPANPAADGRAGRAGRGGGGGGGGARGGRGRGGVALGLTARVGLLPAVPDLNVVRDADAVIACVGLNSTIEQEGRDRPFELPDDQQKLIQAVAAANPRTIVVNNSGAAVGMTGWIKAPGAVIQAWYLGQEGGIALSDVLFGDYNPSGRLCQTFDQHFEDNPAFANYPGKTDPNLGYPVEQYAEGIFYGYRGYDKAAKDPLFPFGYGLSYTTFSLANMKIDKSGADVKVSLDVQNTGQRAGAEVVQIYVGEQGCPLPRPVRELKGFDKVMLNPGETRRVEIVLPHDSFAYWSPDKKGWTVDSGNTFNIEAGVSERDIKLKDSIQVQ